jgi:hypothetical protein
MRKDFVTWNIYEYVLTTYDGIFDDIFSKLDHNHKCSLMEYSAWDFTFNHRWNRPEKWERFRPASHVDGTTHKSRYGCLKIWYLWIQWLMIIFPINNGHLEGFFPHVYRTHMRIEHQQNPGIYPPSWPSRVKTSNDFFHGKIGSFMVNSPVCLW